MRQHPSTIPSLSLEMRSPSPVSGITTFTTITDPDMEVTRDFYGPYSLQKPASVISLTLNEHGLIFQTTVPHIHNSPTFQSPCATDLPILHWALRLRDCAVRLLSSIASTATKQRNMDVADGLRARTNDHRHIPERQRVPASAQNKTPSLRWPDEAIAPKTRTETVLFAEKHN
jgi:hypothetical protein